MLNQKAATAYSYFLVTVIVREIISFFFSHSCVFDIVCAIVPTSVLYSTSVLRISYTGGYLEQLRLMNIVM